MPNLDTCSRIGETHADRRVVSVAMRFINDSAAIVLIESLI